jgi:hypothetical protein
MAEAERLDGRFNTSVELTAIAQELELQAKHDPTLSGIMVEGAKRRQRGKKSQGGDGIVMGPGALPAAARRAVTKEVAGIFDKAGETVFKSSLAKFRETFMGVMEAAQNEVKTAIKEQYGAAGVAQYAPFMGEWRNAILADLMEHGAGELMQMDRYVPPAQPAPAAPEAHTAGIKQAYKGYLITEQLGGGAFHVSKDGHHITTQPSLEKAKRAIDEVA